MPALVTTAQNGTGSTGVASVASPATSHSTGNLLAVGVRANGGADVNSVTDTAGNVFNRCNGSFISANSETLVWYYAANIVGNAANVVTAAFNGSYQFTGIVVLEYSGLALNFPFDVAATGASAGSVNTVTSASFTPYHSGDVIVALAGQEIGGGVWTAGSGFTNRANTSNSDCQAEDNQSAAGGAQTAALTYSRASAMAISVACFGTTDVYVPVTAPPFLTSVAVSGFPVWPAFTFGAGIVNVAYSQDFDLYPALSPTTYTLASGTLPPGLALSNVSGDVGRLSGTPTTAGSYTFTLRATNSLGTADKAFTVTITTAGGASYLFVS